MSDESTGLHEASHYKFTRRVITPTFPVEGDYLKIETEEAIFGILFAYMFFWLMKQLRGVFAWYRESRELRRAHGSDPVGVTVDEDDESGSDADEDYEVVQKGGRKED